MQTICLTCGCCAPAIQQPSNNKSAYYCKCAICGAYTLEHDINFDGSSANVSAYHNSFLKMASVKNKIEAKKLKGAFVRNEL